MKRFKLFIDNFIIYGLGGILGKLLPFIALPIITRLLPDPYYMGINDVLNTIISFASAIAVMGMYDAMFRLFFENEDKIYRIKICSSAFAFTNITAVLLLILLTGFRGTVARFLLEDFSLGYLILICGISVFVSATNNIVAAPTRMQNNRKVYLLTNLLTPIASYIAVFVLLYHKAYLYALPVGGMLSSVVKGLVFWGLNKNWFSYKYVRKKYIKELLRIGLPLFPSFLIYWIFNSCDRIMIAKIIGISYTGIYAVGSKFGQISNLIYTGFAGGWQYFAFSTMHDTDQVELTSRIFEYLSCITVCATIVITICSGYFFGILFDERYSEAVKTIPYLFMAPLIQMLYQIAANQFLVIKRTLPFSMILFLGAIVNISINYILIPEMGIEGAALATLSGFAISTLICIVFLSKMKLFSISLRCIFIFVEFICFLIIWRWSIISGNLFFSLVTGLGIMIIGIFLYQEDIKKLYMNLRN